MDIEIAKRQALNNEFINSSIGAAFKTRKNKIYTGNVTDADKQPIKGTLRNELKSLFKIYVRGEINDGSHFSTIENFSNKLSNDYGCKFINNRFRIGISQKVINVYLKLLWCAGWIPTPPHCPFDNIIIGKLRKGEYLGANMVWTTIDCLDDYKVLLKAARQAACDTKEESLSSWELKTYLNSQG